MSPTNGIMSVSEDIDIKSREVLQCTLVNNIIESDNDLIHVEFGDYINWWSFITKEQQNIISFIHSKQQNSYYLYDYDWDDRSLCRWLPSIHNCYKGKTIMCKQQMIQTCVLPIHGLTLYIIIPCVLCVLDTYLE